ncbi:MAG TPA: hypothetical protein VL738_12385 [Dactylosporangium sp.]|nr:hypothetical protein [Dactylosporangium sp.]
METAGRTLSPQLLATLTHWPRLVGRPLAPHRILVEEVADALELHRGDLLAVAGLDDPAADR